MPRITAVEVFHYGTRVRPGLPVPFAIALSISTSPYPNLRATSQSPAATLPSDNFMESPIEFNGS
jgi:hypothetical protein